MKTSRLTASALLLAASQALNILISNDDGFGSAQIVAMGRALKAAGHTVLTVAPVDNESGQGGRAVFTTNQNLTVASEYNYVPAGSPSLGRSPFDNDVWYYNGTPAACVFVALDFVIPRYYPQLNNSIDLFVAGPNFGANLGTFVYGLSGTMGSTIAAIGRGLPGIAFSGGNTEQRGYTWINETTKSGHPDPAVLQGQFAADLVTALINGTEEGERLLPLGYGLNVNTPFVTSLINDSCVCPTWVQTRMTGDAFTDFAAYSETTGLFHYANLVGDGINRCINGDCNLPGETEIYGSGHSRATVSVFTVDYDAPTGSDQVLVRQAFSSLVQYQTTSKRSTNAIELSKRMPVHGGSF